ncbi:cell cycle progression protein 1 isoform X2 [Microcaecilia unicolor]|uniref:Cell cycle progression protein 1 isoform X2 n=1 Tax=Microcaecilia unicolor TaxID=1415580 RepID=A0A6P7WP51_9AMPH|nr:cell cycle progression protein 1 isoform X2 [Microcaecilia unicolor]
MSGNSSDSESSSCGWTIINHEGSDIETLTCENGESNGSLESEETPAILEAELEDRPQELRADCEDSTVTAVGGPRSLLDQTVPATEVEDDKLSDVGCIGGISDDSDIVTLEPPKVEEMETQEEVGPVDEDVEYSEDFNMGTSSSSQYTFSQPETEGLLRLWKIPERVREWSDQLRDHVIGSFTLQVFVNHFDLLARRMHYIDPHRASADESSNDEASDQSGPTLKRRRAKRRTVSASDSDDQPPVEQDVPQQKEKPSRLNSKLNSCIILALVIAISMGFGHFHGKLGGTIQIQERQKQVEKIHEDELNDMKDDLFQCQREQEETVNHKVKTEDFATCLKVTEVEKLSFESQKDDLATENQHLRESLEKEEKALSSLQEELRKLREQIRNLEEKDVGTELVLTENHKLKEHLEEEKQRISNVLSQRKTYLAEAQMLRRELDKERHITEALREELEQLTSLRSPEDSNTQRIRENQEIESLQGRLTELEKKLNFEQQRSDLWERLYIEAKEQNEKPENYEKEQKKDGKEDKMKKKPKGSLFGSVKDTFDAMKNSTKEFVRHHKEKIKQAKEAVKQNLKKFSDSVKSTFRQFKDSTKNMFDRNRNRKTGEKKQEDIRKAKAAYREYQDSHPKPHLRNAPRRAPGMQTQSADSRTHKPIHEKYGKEKSTEKCSHDQGCSRSQHSHPKGCTGVFECAHQESFSLFNKVLDPVRADEFNQLLQRYLQQEVEHFHHWGELEKFINKFFCNGVFIHDQMLFTDFVNNVEDYLEDMEEYRTHSDDVFEDLDEFVYKHLFGNSYSTPHGSSQHLKMPHHKSAKGFGHRKQDEHQLHYKKEGICISLPLCDSRLLIVSVLCHHQ